MPSTASPRRGRTPPFELGRDTAPVRQEVETLLDIVLSVLGAKGCPR